MTTTTQTTLAAPQLRHLCDLAVSVSPPIEAGNVTGLNSRGRRRIIPITGGTVTGRINGKVVPAGADFQIVVSDTCADLDAQYMLELDSGHHVFVKNRAIRRASAEEVARLVSGLPVDPNRVYFRCVPTFEVSDPELKWMTESVFIGTAARAPDGVFLSFYEVL